MKKLVGQPITTSLTISRAHWLAVGYLLLFITVALLAPLLPLGFDPNANNLNQTYLAPLQWQFYQSNQPFHWLGTDHLGRDLLANMVFGGRTALVISLPAMLAATVIGVFLGSLAGYFRDTGFKISRAAILLLLPLLISLYFYGFYADWHFLAPTNSGKLMMKGASILLLLAAFAIITSIISRLSWLGKKISLPLDFMVLRAIELTLTLPRLLLVLCLAPFLTPAVSTIIWLLIFTYWPAIARITRAEITKQKALPYLEAANALGYSHRRILFKHALPNMLTPVVVAFAFGWSSLMALESTLSFLGFGIPLDTPSWGRAIISIRQNYTAWWLVFFPGLLLCTTVISIQATSSFIIKLINPKIS